MSDDLVAKAEALADGLDYCPDFSEEQQMIRLLVDDIRKWQEIAARQHALITTIEGQEQYAYSRYVVLSESEIARAKEELGIEIIQDVAYVTRLERGLLEAEYKAARCEYLMEHGADAPEQDGRYQKTAQEALEKIRHEM